MNRKTVLVLVCVGVACSETAAPPTALPPPLNCVAAPQGMLHWWPGDGSGADIVGGAGAALMDGATYTAGLVSSGGGQAFSFDGVDAVARIPHVASLSPSAAFSVVAWARPGPVPTPNGAVVGKGHPFDEAWVIDHHNGLWRSFIRNANLQDSRIHGGALRPGVWTHLTLTWDGQQVIFYVDGVSQGARAMTSINPSDAFVGIGARSEVGFADAALDLEFAGDVEEVAFFSRSLTASEVTALHGAGADGMCKP